MCKVTQVRIFSNITFWLRKVAKGVFEMLQKVYPQVCKMHFLVRLRKVATGFSARLHKVEKAILARLHMPVFFQTSHFGSARLQKVFLCF